MHLRAERNLRELVRNDHKTHVGHDQRLDVDNDQHTVVGGLQELHVEGDHRKVKVDHLERHEVDENRHLTVGGMHEVIVRGEQFVGVDQNETYEVHGAREVTIDRALTETVGQGITTTVNAGGVTQTVNSGGLEQTVVGGVTATSHGDRSVSVTGEHRLESTAATKIRAQNISLSSKNDIELTAPGGIRNLTPTSEETVALSVRTQAETSNDDFKTKFDTYDIACTIVRALKLDLAGIKVAVSYMKVDEYEVKVDNGTIKGGNWSAARAERSGVTLFG